MLAPSSLPGWRDFNRAVLEALAARVGRETNPQFVQQRLETLLARREMERAYAPDFMAQLMEEEIGTDYFRVLQALDSQACNQNHAAIAALARDGHVRAIVTTNFDQLLERALTHEGVAYRVFASVADFDQLPDALSDEATPVPVIKVHGTVDRIDTMVDTLAQRVRGRPESLNAAITRLLERHECLTLGFSGADLDYDPSYLGLKAAAATACRLTVLVRSGEDPYPAMRRLVAEFGERGEMIAGTLPGVLADLAGDLGATVAATNSEQAAVNWQERLSAHATAWVDSLGTMPALTMFIALVDANGDDPWMIDFLLYFRRYYRTEEHTVDPWSGTPSYWRYEYQFGRRLLERGRLTSSQHERDNGQRLLSSTVISFRSHEDALNMLGNASERGNLTEARIALSDLTFWVYGPGRAAAHATQTWEKVAESADRRHDVLAMVTISRVFEYAGEYEAALGASAAGIADARRTGDEPRRAAALIQYVRSLACVSRYEEAERALGEAGEVATRLSLNTLTADVRAAHGMLDVLRSRDAHAIEPLSLACAHYRQSERLPRLFMTLLDLARAAFYAGDNTLLLDTQREVHSLCDLFPRAEGLVSLLTGELARHNQEWDLLARVCRELEGFATYDAEYPWRWGLRRVERMRGFLPSGA